MGQPRTVTIIAALMLLGLVPPVVLADDPRDWVGAELAREIIGPHRTLAEVQDFVESRVPRMPLVRSFEEWNTLADRARERVFQGVIFRGEAETWRQAERRVEWAGEVEGGEGYRIKKLRFEVVPDLWVPALLYEPKDLTGKVPVVLNVNGHDSGGKAAEYKQIRCINQAKRGMIALNLEWFGMGQLRGEGFRHGLINGIDLCGTSGIALHYLAMSRGLDLLLDHPHADPRRVAVAGLSGGGWQTIFFSALDPRVTLSNPVAGYSSFLTRVRYFSDLGDSEQTPSDLATVVDYAHLTAMRAPRPTLLTFNAKDNCCFAAPHALPPLLDAAGPIFDLATKPEYLRHHINEDPGDHNFGLDNRLALYRMFRDFFGPDDPRFVLDEIDGQGEVRTAEELAVPLPEDNLDFQRIAVNLAKGLPRSPEPGGDDPSSWVRQKRLRLRSVVRPYDEATTAEEVASEGAEGLMAIRWSIRVASAWTVPAIEFRRREDAPTGIDLMIADRGRASLGDRVRASLEEGRRVVVLDPFGFGESQVEEKSYLFQLAVGAVGERPLGIQAGQVMAVARQFAAGKDSPAVRLVAVGPRTGLVALTASTMEPEAIKEVCLVDPPASLKSLLEAGVEYQAQPEAFCFGLLQVADIRQLAMLTAPRRLEIREISEAARPMFEGLRPWYARLGASGELAPRVEEAPPGDAR